ncbi:MAG: beta-ketoacyl-ACP synthase 3 [Nanoarchaeota archaeon]
MRSPYVSLSVPGIYVPPAEGTNVLTNADLERIVETTDGWIFSHTGIRERRISHDKDVRAMGVLAVQDLLKKTGCAVGEIDEIIFATNSHDNKQEFPVHAGYVGRQIGAKNFPPHDTGAGCTGLVFAIRNAFNALVVEDKKKIIVVGSERLSSITDYSDRTTCILFGDGAGAYLLEKHTGRAGEGIIKNVVGGTPDMGNAEWPKGYLALDWKKGKRIRPGKNPAESKFEVYKQEQDYLVMNGPKVYRFAATAMSHAVHEVLKDTAYALADIDVIIPHGANIRIIDAAREKLESGEKGFKGKIYTNLEHYGNTSTASIPIAAEEAIRKELLKQGDLYVMVAFGAGLTWGASLIRHV